MPPSYNSLMLLPLLMLLAASSPAEAKTKAVVSGVVTEGMGAVVPGTEISFTNERTGKKVVVVTTSEVGRYEVKLPPGVYSLSTEKHAFCSFRRAGVRFEGGERQVIDIEMRARPCGPHLEPGPVEPQTAPIPWSLAADAKPIAAVSGSVTDVNGAVVPGTKITFMNERTKQKTLETTSEVGRYEAKLLPGVYSVFTEKPGFHRFRRSGIRLREGQEYVIDIQLKCCIEDIVIAPDEPSKRRHDRYY